MLDFLFSFDRFGDDEIIQTRTAKTTFFAQKNTKAQALHAPQEEVVINPPGTTRHLPQVHYEPQVFASHVLAAWTRDSDVRGRQI